MAAKKRETKPKGKSSAPGLLRGKGSGGPIRGPMPGQDMQLGWEDPCGPLSEA